MKKIDHYKLREKTTTFDFHKNVVAQKYYKRSVKPGEVDQKKEVEAIADIILSEYEKYDKAFAENSLEELATLEITDTQKSSLLSLYSYEAHVFKELRNQLTTNANGQKETLCPLCRLDHEGSLDHCVPKEEFPQFCDHPYNLIPCCLKCNPKKGDRWRESGVRTALNLYLDDIPQSQYLFSKLELVQNQQGRTIVNCQFEVDDPNGDIKDIALYNRIKLHYIYTGEASKKNLLQRFNEAAADAISDIQDQITGEAYAKFTTEEVSKQLKHQATKMQERYGYNYWKAILTHTIANRNDIIDYLRHP